MAVMDYGRFSPFNDREGQWLASMAEIEDLSPGHSSMDRAHITGTHAHQSGFIVLTYFTGVRDETITKVELTTGNIAAAPTPTLQRVGLYEVDSSENLTLVASTPNNTALFSATFTKYSVALSAGYAIKKGQRYAIGIIIVSIAALPSLHGSGATLDVINGYPPRISGRVSATDLLSTISSASIQDTSSVFFIAMLP